MQAIKRKVKLYEVSVKLPNSDDEVVKLYKSNSLAEKALNVFEEFNFEVRKELVVREIEFKL